MSPKYQTIVDTLLREIDELRPGDKIDTEYDLAARFGVSRMTVRQALQVLASMDRIVGVRGRGTFVADRRIRKSGAEGASFTEVVTRQSLIPSTDVLDVVDVQGTAPFTAELGLDADARLLRVRRLRLGDGNPLCLETSHLPVSRFPDLGDLDLRTSLYELLAQRYGVRLRSADVRLTSRRATGAESKLLQLSRGAPVMQAISTTRDADGTIVETTTSVYRGDRYEFQLHSRLGSR